MILATENWKMRLSVSGRNDEFSLGNFSLSFFKNPVIFSCFQLVIIPNADFITNIYVNVESIKLVFDTLCQCLSYVSSLESTNST